MHDGKALQSGTSHNFGNGFAKAFGIEYTDKDNKLTSCITRHHGECPHVSSVRSSWYTVMTADLYLPPRIAPVQTMIIPIQQKKEGVLR